MIVIRSTANGKVKRIVNLQKKKKLRDEENVFLTEGIRMFREVPGERLQEVYISERFYGKEQNLIESVLKGAPAEKILLSDSVYAHVSDTKTPQGILCVVRRKEYSLSGMLEGDVPFLLALDNLQDPGNVGMMLRTAEGAGVTGVVLSRDSADIYNPKTIRSTMGSVFRVPFCYVDDLAETLGRMHDAGICTYAAHLDGKHAYDEEDYRKSCAFLIGNEGNGIREELLRKAKVYIRIPMKGQVESLNAAAAASILMFEAARQRRK